MLIKKFLFTIFCILLFILLEVTSYLIIPNTKLNTLESIFRVLEEDNEIFWKQRPYLNTKFQGVDVVTNSLGFRNKEITIRKAEHCYRMICLGASPTFGWGVNSFKTYPFLLEQILKKNILTRASEVINAGQIGYTTYQGKILLEKYLFKYSPDLVTISYVLNDIDRYRFYRNEGLSDKELPKNNILVIKLNNILNESRQYLLLKRIISFLVDNNDKLSASMLKRQVNLSKIRVSGYDYRRNLQQMIETCMAHNVKVILIKMPINLSSPTLTDFENNLYRVPSRLSKFYFDIGCSYENIKQYKKARFLFKKAKDYQVLECYRDGTIYQHIMEELAHRYNISLVDASAVFLREGKDVNLFNGPHDPIHPNEIGHRLIAEAIYTEMKHILFY